MKGIVEGQLVKGRVEAIGKQGNPLIKIDGVVVFINTKEQKQVGDLVRAKVCKVLDKFCFADEMTD